MCSIRIRVMSILFITGSPVPRHSAYHTVDNNTGKKERGKSERRDEQISYFKVKMNRKSQKYYSHVNVTNLNIILSVYSFYKTSHSLTPKSYDF